LIYPEGVVCTSHTADLKYSTQVVLLRYIMNMEASQAPLQSYQDNIWQVIMGMGEMHALVEFLKKLDGKV